MIQTRQDASTCKYRLAKGDWPAERRRGRFHAPAACASEHANHAAKSVQHRACASKRVAEGRRCTATGNVFGSLLQAIARASMGLTNTRSRIRLGTKTTTTGRL